MKKLTQKQIQKIEDATLRLKLSSRGGGIEISLTAFGFPGERMTAYQNYLGGGILGAVGPDCTLLHKNVRYNAERLERVSEMLKQYFFDLTNPEDEWSRQSYA